MTARNAEYCTARALQIKSLPNLDDLTISFNHGAPQDDSYEPPSALFSEIPFTDHLSLSLNELSQKLTKLRLDGGAIISTSLLWPTVMSNGKPDCYWPNLTFVPVDFHVVTSEGFWCYDEIEANDPKYQDWSSDESQSYERDSSDFYSMPGDKLPYGETSHWNKAKWYAEDCGDHPKNKFRKTPNPRILTPMFLAAARQRN